MSLLHLWMTHSLFILVNKQLPYTYCRVTMIHIPHSYGQASHSYTSHHDYACLCNTYGLINENMMTVTFQWHFDSVKLLFVNARGNLSALVYVHDGCPFHVHDGCPFHEPPLLMHWSVINHSHLLIIMRNEVIVDLARFTFHRGSACQMASSRWDPHPDPHIPTIVLTGLNNVVWSYIMRNVMGGSHRLLLIDHSCHCCELVCLGWENFLHLDVLSVSLALKNLGF